MHTKLTLLLSLFFQLSTAQSPDWLWANAIIAQMSDNGNAIATDASDALPVAARCTVLDLNVADDVAAWLVDNAERFEYRTPLSP